MNSVSPSLTASSSTTAFIPTIPQISPSDVNMDKEMQDFSDLFDFDHFESSGSSHTHSPRTISPNHTPSPLPEQHPSPFAASPSAFDFLNPDNEFDYSYAEPVQKAQTSVPAQSITVKQEPLDFAFINNTVSQQPVAPIEPSPQLDQMGFEFGGLPADQQLALQQLLSNMLKYQEQYGADLPAPSPGASQIVAPVEQPIMQGTIQPSMLLNTPSTLPSFSAASSTAITPASTSYAAAPGIPAAPQRVEEHEDEPLVAVEAHEQAPSLAVNVRQGSPNDDIDAKIQSLIPLPDIFSAGRGKGGKKGGGMSSVVRAEDEDIDDDDSWRPSPEEYKKLSSKEKRQLRNKLSARAFRNRRKDYIGTLEAHIKDRDTVIDAIRSELLTSRSETQDLRRELDALKANTMAILHPETADTNSQSPALQAAFAINASLAANVKNSERPPAKRLSSGPTPKFNPRKDLPSSPAVYDASRGYWGGSNDFLGGGGSTICHTLFSPDLVVSEREKAAQAPASLRGLPDLPRRNLNPRINDDADVRMPSLANVGNAKDLNGSFSEWSENNAFSLRSMDTYRIQMWSRLAREAASDKQQIPADIRPKFYVESAYAQAASSHISSKLSSSFWSAFSGTTAGKLDNDKLAAVVTGKARLKVVDIAAESEAERLAAALSGLTLQTGISKSEGQCLRVRENPLGALSSFFRCSSAMRC